MLWSCLLKKQRGRGALILQFRSFWLPSKVKDSFGVNEIKKTAPNRKQRGFVERSLSFLNCGEKLFSSSFRNLVGAETFTAEILIFMTLMKRLFLQKTLSKIRVVVNLEKRGKKEAILPFEFVAKITAHQHHENDDFSSKSFEAP